MLSTNLLCGALVALLLGTCAMAQEERFSPFRRLPPCPSFSYDALYDFANGVTRTHPNITVDTPFEETGCKRRGVLKIALASAALDPSRRRVMVDFFFTDPTGWVFNLGDSSTNNGYAGDYSTQSNDAEVQGTGTTFNGYLSDVGGSGLAFTYGNFYNQRLTLIAGDGQVTYLTENVMNYYSNPAMFALNGQADATGPVNYDLYLGLNRVIYGPGNRVGSGLCKVGIKYLPEV